MKVFHHGCHSVRDTPSESAVERGAAETVLLLSKLGGTGAFLGVELDGNTVLQFWREEGMLHTEILDKKSRRLEHCLLNVPLAEQALRAAFRNQNIKQVAEDAFIKWHHGQLA